MSERIRNMNILIFGASSGLGKALADQLAEDGAHLFVASRRIEEVVFEYPVTKIPCDVRDSNSVKEAFQQVEKVDVVINSSGVGLEKPLDETTDQEIDDVLDINLKGVINT